MNHISFKNYRKMIKFKLMNIWQSQQPFLMFVKVDPKPYSLGGFKDSKQFNIKGTQRLVYTHNVNLMTPSTELCKHRSTQIL